MSIMLKFSIVGVTDTGRCRAHNEDSIGWDMTRNLAVLADGMGGHSAGAVASRMTVDGILQDYRLPSASTVREQAVITQLLDNINSDIYRLAQEDPACAHMGTTLVMLCLSGGHVTVASAGDSRVYRLRDGELEQLTEDHSLVRQLIEQGTMSAEDAENSRYNHVITRALGVRAGCEVDINQYPADSDDVYLLCSDGLSNKITDERIKQVLCDSGTDWQKAADTLVDAANVAGGEDNISVVLAVVTTEA